MQVIYNKKTNEIERILSQPQDLRVYFNHCDSEFISNLSSFTIDKLPPNWKNCRIVDNKFVEKSKEELLENRKYGRVLSEKERLLVKLSPTQSEIDKAEHTIELFEILIGVGII